MDAVYDRTGDGRSIKNLTAVDDATHKVASTVAERKMAGILVVRISDQIAATRGLLKAIRTDNGKHFCCRVKLK